MVLFINACVRDDSRTKKLADHLLSKLSGPVEEVRLWEIPFPVADEAFLRQRDALIGQGNFDHPLFDLARRFASADEIVIAAPYWDLSFPAALKQYMEQINVVGVTFIYTPEGIPQGLCQGKRIFYVSTAGGDFAPMEFGYEYVKSLAQNYYGIHDVQLVLAKGLDLIGADEAAILQGALKEIDNLFD